MNAETATHVTVNNKPLAAHLNTEASREIEQVRREEIRQHSRHRPITSRAPINPSTRATKERFTRGLTMREMRARRRERVALLASVIRQHPKGILYSDLLKATGLTDTVVSKSYVSQLLAKTKAYRYRTTQRGPMIVSFTAPPVGIRQVCGWRLRKGHAKAKAAVASPMPQPLPGPMAVPALNEADLWGSAAALLHGLATVCERLSKNGSGK